LASVTATVFFAPHTQKFVHGHCHNVQWQFWLVSVGIVVATVIGVQS